MAIAVETALGHRKLVLEGDLALEADSQIPEFGRAIFTGSDELIAAGMKRRVRNPAAMEKRHHRL